MDNNKNQSGMNKLYKLVKSGFSMMMLNLNWINIFTGILFLYLIYGAFNIFVLKIIIWPILIIIILLTFKEQIYLILSNSPLIKLIIPGLIGLEVSQEQKLSKEIPDDFIKQQESEINKQKTVEDKRSVKELRDQVEALTLIVQFERIFYLLFPSQIELLKSMDKGRTFDSVGLHSYFEFVKSKTFLFNNWTWKQYISFLESVALISLNNDGSYSITPIGKSFLSYMSAMNYKKIGLL